MPPPRNQGLYTVIRCLYKILETAESKKNTSKINFRGVFAS